MRIERITSENRDSWIADLIGLGNAFLASIGVRSRQDRENADSARLSRRSQ